MSSPYNYNPIPPRVWSRVQNGCTYIIPNNSYNSVYIPLTNQTTSLAQANYEDKLIYKGNILQYKGNSSRLTKSQKYTQIAKGYGPSRTKSFATQSQTYTNPNTSGLLRVNYDSIPYPNQLVGKPNNISGPYQYNVPNPFDCSSNYLQDGGTLVCGTYANPCTGEIIKHSATSATICNPSYCSDVPGTPIELCWNKKVQTWFPRQRYFMNNSTDKWPQGYKGLVSAVSPNAPTDLIVQYVIGDNFTTLSWNIISLNCLPVSNFNIYQNNKHIKTVPYNTTTTTVNNVPNCSYLSYYVTSVSNGIESPPSNTETTETYYIQYPIITNVNVEDIQATIYWSKPSSCAEVSYYNIYQDSSLLMSGIASNIYSMLITDLSNCTDYTFNVSYYDSLLNMESPLSNTVIVTQIPEPPTLDSAEPYNSQVTLSFTAPSVTCQPISYNLYYSNDTLIQTNITSPYILTGLTNGQTYSFYLKSYSILNNMYSSSSNILTAILTIPDPPTNVISSLIPSQFSSLQVNWIEPVLSQSPPITYNIYTSENSGPFIYYGNEPYGSVGGNKMITITGLNYGNVYQIGIESINTYNINSSMTLSTPLTLPEPDIDITSVNNNISLSNYSQFDASGVIIFTSSGSFTINVLDSSINMTLFAIGGGGSGGYGGNNGGGAFTGGSGGGGGGGYIATQNVIGGIYSTTNFIVNVGGTSSIISSIITVTGNSGYNGSNGQNAGLLNYGSGGSGGSGNGSGGHGSDGGSSNDSNGSNGSPNSNSFIIGGNTYNIYFGGGGGGGAYQQRHAYGGSYCGGQGGTGSGGSGNRSGDGGVINISSGIGSIYVGGGGGGGSGSNGSNGYNGGGGSSGIVGIYWSY